MNKKNLFSLIIVIIIIIVIIVISKENPKTEEIIIPNENGGVVEIETELDTITIDAQIEEEMRLIDNDMEKL